MANALELQTPASNINIPRKRFFIGKSLQVPDGVSIIVGLSPYISMRAQRSPQPDDPKTGSHEAAKDEICHLPDNGKNFAIYRMLAIFLSPAGHYHWTAIEGTPILMVHSHIARS